MVKMLNDYERLIIGGFLGNLDENDQKIMTLIWPDGSKIVAEFDTYFEDLNDFDAKEGDDEFDEYISFVFVAKEVFGVPPIQLNSNGFFLINYHNFPDEIIADGKKMN